VCGGTFYRSYDDVTYTSTAYPAMVSNFRLDKYEITVGRFRQFVAAVVGGWLPPAGSGKHTYLNDGHGLNATGGGYEEGWDAADWNSLLATTLSDWTANLSCYSNDETWTASRLGNESKPINCETWQEAYAFCIWDGGFLPSEAEWNYAAAGGGGANGQRVYPWSHPSRSTTLNCKFANDGCPPGAVGSGPNNVGSESPTGDGLYGQADLAGNVWEWNLDWFAPYVTRITNFANLTVTYMPFRVIRGGGFDDGPPALLASSRDSRTPTNRLNDVGARCARTP